MRARDAREATLALRSAAGVWLERPDASPLRELLTLAWPIATAMFGETFMGLVDTKLVGGLGAAALGGVGLGTMLMYLGYAIVFGLMRGVKVRTAFAVGQRRPREGLAYAKAGALLGLLVGIGILLVGRDATWALRALGVAPELVAPARDFFAAITLGAPATCVLSALIQHRQGMGDSRSPMIVGISGNVLNAALAWGLIYGHWGFPALGVRGAGYATASTEVVEVLALGALLARDVRRSRGKRTLGLGQALRAVTDLGLPTALQFGSETLAFTAFTAVLGSLGSVEIAAHQVALQTIRVSFLPGVAISEAGSVLVGRALGQRRLDAADEVTLAAMKTACVFMALCGVGFALLGRFVASAFAHDPEVVETARRLLLVAAAFQVMDAVNIVLRGALRGAKDVRAAAIIGVTTVWTCLPVAAYVLGKQLGWGAFGGWCGFLGETCLGALLCWRRWKYGAWRLAYTR